MAARPGRYADVLRDRPYVAIVLLNTLLVAGGFAVLEAGLPAFAKNQLGLSERAIGFLFFLNVAVVVLLQLPVAKLLAGRSRLRALAAMSVAFCCAWLLVLVAGLWLQAAAAGLLLAVAVLVFSLAECVHAPAQGGLVADLAAEGLQGRYFALSTNSYALGFTLGPAAAGLLLGAAPLALWPCAALVCIAAAAAAPRRAPGARGRAPWLPEAPLAVGSRGRPESAHATQARSAVPTARPARGRGRRPCGPAARKQRSLLALLLPARRRRRLQRRADRGALGRRAAGHGGEHAPGPRLPPPEAARAGSAGSCAGVGRRGAFARLRARGGARRARPGAIRAAAHGGPRRSRRRRPRGGGGLAPLGARALARQPARRRRARAVRTGRDSATRGAARGGARTTGRGRPGPRAPRRARGGARATGRRAPASGAASRAVDARPLPLRPAGRRARGLPGGPAGARRAAWPAAGSRPPAPRAGDPAPGTPPRPGLDRRARRGAA